MGRHKTKVRTKSGLVSTRRVPLVLAAMTMVVVSPFLVGSLATASGHGGWRITASGNVSPRDGLADVACPQSGSCVAVGDYYSEETAMSPFGPFVDVSSGDTWQPEAAGADYSRLSAVSCWSSDGCVLVGTVAYPGESALIESWDGSGLNVEPNPAPPGSSLDGVSCPGPSSCTAVGAVVGGTLIESWDGSTWSVVPSFTPDSGGWLTSVSCTSATACVAVGGSSTATSTDNVLIEIWDGSTWSDVPQTSGSSSVLNGVSCVDATDCTAVGEDSLGQGHSLGYPLIESWSGASWSTVPTRAHGHRGELVNVSCVALSSCTAVGFHTRTTLIEQWHGTAWSTVHSPNAPHRSSSLSGVSCPSTTSCVAVGTYLKTIPESQNLIETRGG